MHAGIAFREHEVVGVGEEMQLRRLAGVLEQLEIPLWPKEQQGLLASAKTLQETWAKVKPRQ